MALHPPGHFARPATFPLCATNSSPPHLSGSPPPDNHTVRDDCQRVTHRIPRTLCTATSFLSPPVYLINSPPPLRTRLAPTQTCARHGIAPSMHIPHRFTAHLHRTLPDIRTARYSPFDAHSPPIHRTSFTAASRTFARHCPQFTGHPPRHPALQFPFNTHPSPHPPGHSHGTPFSLQFTFRADSSRPIPPRSFFWSYRTPQSSFSHNPHLVCASRAHEMTPVGESNRQLSPPTISATNRAPIANHL